MSVIVRLFEKITGQPHQHHDVAMVRQATRRLIHANEEFQKVIRPYANAENPLELLLKDASNQKGPHKDDKT